MTLNPDWLANFDAAFKRFYAIHTSDAGFSESDLARYADLPAETAALELGADYDLERVDLGWG